MTANGGTKDVLKRVGFLSDLGLWAALPREADPRGWLSNFDDSEDQAIAVALLRSFIYVSRDLTDQLVLSAIQGVYGATPVRTPLDWASFLNTTLLTYPTSRKSDAAASGHLFLRAARDQVGFREDQLVDPRDLVSRIEAADHPQSVVFVDDIAASGSQFIDTVVRKEAPGANSIAELLTGGLISTLVYAPAIATSYALRQIRELTPIRDIKPAHILPGDYSASDPLTRLVPEERRNALESFLQRYADSAGYNETEPYGYHRLGLAIGFEHKIPDATLPLFRSIKNDWTPLFR
ncbi:hypothetical protein [Curtobacterium sp. MEB011]|uniref:phosphoribosyltransferase-like protein n=1 Tax=Curtobacterium sp. MEB011 TaxID=3040285 RepID=UPI002551A023|nr:hypothetical protein [Curtobacterium sp. MEB011]